VLIQQLAVTKVQRQQETTYRLIFGSQIQVLNDLNLLGPSPKEKLMAHYHAAKAQFPNAYESYDESRYIGFLEDTKLLQQMQQDYVITALGKEFLSWLAEQGISPAKPF
jgi:hypothetical protein